MHPEHTPARTTDEKLDRIVDDLDKMNRRDRLRTIGGFIRGILGLIPLVVLLASLWYVYSYGEELMGKIAGEAAKQAASYTQNSDLLKNVQNMMKR